MPMFTTEKQFNRYLALFIIVVLGAIMYFALSNFLGMLFGAVIIFTLFRPIQKALVIKFKWNRGLAAITTIFISIFALVIPTVLTILVIGNAIATLLRNNFETIQNWFSTIPSLVQQENSLLTREFFPGFTLANAITNINIDYTSLLRTLSTFLQNLITGITTGASSFFLQAIVMYFILYFVFKDWEKFAVAFYRFSPFNTKNTQRLIKEFDNMTFSNIVGSGAVALAQGVAIWLGFVIFGVPDALFWGFITVVTSFLPLVGAPLIWIPTVIILILQGNWFGAIGLFIWSATIVSWIDNFVRPYITSKVGNIHPLISIVGIFIGIPMFGILGIILGPALLSFFIITTNMYYEEFLSGDNQENDSSVHKKTPKTA